MANEKTKYAMLPLTRGVFAKIDPEDFERVNKISWMFNPALSGSVRSKDTTLGKFLLNCPKDKLVINLNGDCLDFRKSNLMICSHSEKGQHRTRGKRAGITSQYKGVGFVKDHKKWKAVITKNYEVFFLGYFESEIEAAEAYDKKALELFGVTCYRNTDNPITRKTPPDLGPPHITKSRPFSKSKFKGVYSPTNSKKFTASIWHQNKSHHLGYFDEPQKAALAYDAKAKELFGKNCYLNFPDTHKSSGFFEVSR